MVLLMSAENLQQAPGFSTEYEGTVTDLQAASPDSHEGPIQLIWIRPVTEVVIDLATDVVENTRGKYTESIDVPPSWDIVNRRSLVRASCRNEAWRLLNPNVFTR